MDSEVCTMKYVILNSENIIVDKIMYDPSSDWTPPTGFTLGAIPDNIDADFGGKWESNTYTAPVIPPLPDDIKKDLNKEQAKISLEESDWIGLADVRDKLTESNLIEWDTYRQTLRSYLGEGSTATRPIAPDVVWKT